MRLILKGSSRCGTTITRDILSAHPEVFLTNELRLYYKSTRTHAGSLSLLLDGTPEEYFNNLLKNINNSNVGKLSSLNKNTFVSDCLQTLTEDTMLGKIEAAESVLFSNNYKYYGDKGAPVSIMKKLPKTKVIFIYRDGRDVASSGARFKRGLKAPWANDPKVNAEHWAGNMQTNFNSLEEFNDCLVIKFEDYIDYPDKNFKLISEFLGLDYKPYKSMINFEKMHKGYYTKHWPNWKKEASVSVIKMLERLKYI